MNRPEREVLERLGIPGLVRVLDDVLDPPRLVKLASAAGIAYPGMRMQSQKRERLLRDLASKAIADDAAGRRLIRALRKQLAKETGAWASLDVTSRETRLKDVAASGRNGGVGLHLFLIASAPPDPVTEPVIDALASQASEPASPSAASDGSDTRELTRLRKKSAELQRKVRHLEAQIGKNREAERLLKRDLIQRKGELAESRMLAEKLRRDLAEAGMAAAKPTPPSSDAVLAEIDRSVKRLSADHRKLAHRIEKLGEPRESPPTAVPVSIVEPVLASIQALEKEIASLRRERRKDLQEQAQRVSDIAGALREIRGLTDVSPRQQRSGARRKGEPERVGVFVDVQNMYYAARQLKGKLDFDALLQAAVLDRRLIHAAAYVVESKEIDQSGFIAMLQQRAIEVRRKTLQVRADGSMKGDWDMEMALDILDAAPKLDVVVLVSGDGDFTSLVKRVKAMGPRVEVVAFPRNTAKSLVEAADRFQPLDRKYMIRTEPSADPAGPPAKD